MNGKRVRIWNEVVVACFKILYRKEKLEEIAIIPGQDSQ
jgi:hypothetical protein